MKRFIIGLALAIAMTACSRQSPVANEQDLAELSIPETTVAEKKAAPSTKAPPLAWEIYINKYAISPTNGCISRSGKGPRDPNSAVTSQTTTCGDTGGPLYEVKVEIPDEKENHYSISITHPIDGGRMTFTRDVIFKGEEIEFYRDDKWRIGIRSDSPRQEPNVDAP